MTPPCAPYPHCHFAVALLRFLGRLLEAALTHAPLYVFLGGFPRLHLGSAVLRRGRLRFQFVDLLSELGGSLVLEGMGSKRVHMRFEPVAARSLWRQGGRVA